MCFLICFTSLALTFDNLVQLLEVTFDQCLFLCARPAFQLAFQFERFVSLDMLVPYQLNRATAGCVALKRAGLMLRQSVL